MKESIDQDREIDNIEFNDSDISRSKVIYGSVWVGLEFKHCHTQ